MCEILRVDATCIISPRGQHLTFLHHSFFSLPLQLRDVTPHPAYRSDWRSRQPTLVRLSPPHPSSSSSYSPLSPSHSFLHISCPLSVHILSSRKKLQVFVFLSINIWKKVDEYLQIFLPLSLFFPRTSDSLRTPAALWHYWDFWVIILYGAAQTFTHDWT